MASVKGRSVWHSQCIRRTMPATATLCGNTAHYPYERPNSHLSQVALLARHHSSGLSQDSPRSLLWTTAAEGQGPPFLSRLLTGQARHCNRTGRGRDASANLLSSRAPNPQGSWKISSPHHQSLALPQGHIFSCPTQQYAFWSFVLPLCDARKCQASGSGQETLLNTHSPLLLFSH